MGFSERASYSIIHCFTNKLVYNHHDAAMKMSLITIAPSSSRSDSLRAAEDHINARKTFSPWRRLANLLF